MTKNEFDIIVEKHSAQIKDICQAAHELHHQVNQSYGEGLPYGYHLDMVVNNIREFGYLVCAGESDILPLFFGGYYHDSIEDARQTYNDVLNAARKTMTEEQALMATEIVYALTNDKGRTRAERAGEKYYKGIRETPYAPFVKLCDRLANITYSCSSADGSNLHMKQVYKEELHHFLSAIHSHSQDKRFAVPKEVIHQLAECLVDDLEREEKNLDGWYNTLVGFYD